MPLFIVAMSGLARARESHCEVGDYVLLSESEVDVDEYTEGEDANGELWVNVKGAKWRFVLEKVDDAEGLWRLRRIEDPAPGQLGGVPVNL